MRGDCIVGSSPCRRCCAPPVLGPGPGSRRLLRFQPCCASSVAATSSAREALRPREGLNGASTGTPRAALPALYSSAVRSDREPAPGPAEGLRDPSLKWQKADYV